MVALRYFSPLFIVALLLFPAADDNAWASNPAGGETLFAQSAAEILAHNFTDPKVSYLLLEATSGRVLASRWEDLQLPIPLGSLVKPFTALAYGEKYGFKFPVLVCRGTATGCWRPGGHGRVDLPLAIAYSCNSYFEMLAARLNAEQVSLTAAHFGIEPPASSASGVALAGIGKEWPISPVRLSRAYLELLRRRDERGVGEIIDGMALSGRKGTGAAVDRELTFGEALVKTGTAPCTHLTRAPGDGFALVLWPTDNPQVLLLVRVHGAPGAQAAKTAGQMLRRIGD
jgi:hypothetical protein